MGAGRRGQREVTGGRHTHTGRQRGTEGRENLTGLAQRGRERQGQKEGRGEREEGRGRGRGGKVRGSQEGEETHTDEGACTHRHTPIPPHTHPEREVDEGGGGIQNQKSQPSRR